MMELETFYRSGMTRLTALIAAKKRWNIWFILLEVTGAVGLVSAICFAAFMGTASWQALLAAFSVLFWIVITRIDIRNGRQIARLEASRLVYDNELKYLQGDFPFDAGNEFVDPHHEYAFDLDIFGADSLYNRICRSVTTGGKKYLADCLQNLHWDDRRPETINELSQNEPFLTEFKSMRYRKVLSLNSDLPQKGLSNTEIDTQLVENAISELSVFHIKDTFTTLYALCLGWLSLAGFFITIPLSVYGFVESSVPLLWGVLQFFSVHVSRPAQLARP